MAAVKALVTRRRIICPAVRRPSLILACSLAALAAVFAGCGHGTKLAPPSSDASVHHGAQLFHERCGGCHTIAAADARGSKPTGQVAAGERTNGPNFDVRKENREDVLFAIRNGGFSGAIMPANVVVGKDADDVALFLERYAGSKSTSQAQNQAPNNK
jgi:mono/diheme cytochrome c family protein